jgi:very-short-patch-repair endonuclease
MDATTAFGRCPQGQRGLATRAQLIAAGLRSTDLTAAVRAGELHRIRRRVYGLRVLEPWAEHVLSGGRVDPAFLREAQAVLLQIGGGAALRGRSAAVAWGLDMLVEPDKLEVQVSPRRRRPVARDITVRRTAEPVQLVGGLTVTTLLGTLRSCAADLPLVEAVAIVDSALRRGLVKVPSLPRAGRLARTVALADPGSGSVLESAMRVLLAEHGWHPQSQYVIRDGGRFVARVDFCFPAARLIVETDGRRWHDPQDARSFDRRRANACASLGWRVLRFTWAEVLHDPAYVVALVRAALTDAVAA